MNILIFGASGATGHALVRQALEQGHHVTAFVRTPAKLKVQHPKLTILQGDVVDASVVQRAIEGKDAVISALGAPSPLRFDQAVVDGVRNIVQAMEQKQVSRFIYLSTLNVKESLKDGGRVIKHLAPLLLRHETAGHEARERIIKQSHLAWTIVRAAVLTNGAHKGLYRSGEAIRSDRMAARISRADVADFILRQLTDTAFVHKAARVMY